MKKIFINPGHGSPDSGAAGFGLNEADVALQVGKLVEQKLKAQFAYLKPITVSRTVQTTLLLPQATDNIGTTVHVVIELSNPISLTIMVQTMYGVMLLQVAAHVV